MKYFLIVGEASGDLHASNLMRELKQQDSAAEFCFLGGDLMLAEGGLLVRHYREMAFMGFVSVVRNLDKVLKNIRDCKSALLDFKPDVVILIDYPSFNLRIAKFVKEKLHLPVIYYIAPKIWAWKEYRIKSIKKYTDKVLTIFPFETEFYRKHQYVVQYVGNPTVDSVSDLLDKTETTASFLQANDLDGRPLIALLAGSRRHEIAKCLPVMLQAARRFPDYQSVVAGAPGVEKEFYSSLGGGDTVPVIFGKTYQLVYHAQAAIVNSGTATLETALIGTPQVVVYYAQPGRLVYLLKKIFLKVEYVSLVNLISGRESVRELIAHLFTPDMVAAETQKLLHNPQYRAAIFADYELVKRELGEPGTARHAAAFIVDYLQNK
ncbi:MAG: lipid-A-disaccharide synthase [Bacteroidetes bacterium]|nr:lipid-A-disaccharide synthase [Bacteroidota bacterium]